MNGADLLDGIAVGVLTGNYPVSVVNAAVAATGAQEQRSRKLPSWVVVYFVMAMALFARSGYADVWRRLLSGLAWQSLGEPYRLLAGQPSTAALAKARARLGWKVMAELFDRSCAVAAETGRGTPARPGIRQRVLYVDATAIDVPDTPANRRGFGLPRQANGTGGPRAGFPQLRAAAIADGCTRQLLAAETGSIREDGSSLARQLLWVAGPGDLVIAGPGLLDAGDFGRLLAAGADVLAPLPGDAGRAGTGNVAPGLPLRVISPAERLVATATGPCAVPAETMGHLYAGRWCLAPALGVLTGQLSGGGEPALRSRGPDGILQEVYGLLCVYQALRSVIRNAQFDPDTLAAVPR